MLSTPSPSSEVPATGPAEPRLPWYALARRWPFAMLLVAVFGSNVAGSIFNIAYNRVLIVHGILDERQAAVFDELALPLYNVVAYSICFGFSLWLIWPLLRCRRKLKAGVAVAPAEMERARRRLVNLPFDQVCVNVAGWLPGMVFFPWIICALGGPNEAVLIWPQFIISFLVSALLTTVQTFFIIEWYLVKFLYADFFQGARPADVRGVFRISFAWRIVLLWSAVGVVPLIALLVVTLNLTELRTDYESLKGLAIGAAVVGALSGGLIFWFLGWDLLHWVRRQAAATEQIALENFDVRIPDKRPDEWGRLSDRFNDMASALQRGQYVRETFGQMVGPDARDLILERYPGLGGEVQEITVLFADIRGFTRRTAGMAPERVFALLNRFLTIIGRVIQTQSGNVDKFLGDGLMAHFNSVRPCEDHADQAVSAAVEIVARLEDLNAELRQSGAEPLRIGIGIHTGPALVGCIGATLLRGDGRPYLRKEFTAIGETVNLAQRLEQLTKTCGGPILISGETHARLRRAPPVVSLGPQALPGCAETLVVFRIPGDQ